jgi:acyl carrier protein
LRELSNIAPEIDPAQIDPKINVRDQVDLDSMNVLDLMVAIHDATGVEIPEADYMKILTIDDFVNYLRPRIKNDRNPAQTQNFTALALTHRGTCPLSYTIWFINQMVNRDSRLRSRQLGAHYSGITCRASCPSAAEVPEPCWTIRGRRRVCAHASGTE